MRVSSPSSFPKSTEESPVDVSEFLIKSLYAIECPPCKQVNGIHWGDRHVLKCIRSAGSLIGFCSVSTIRFAYR